jgi:hypothetical protein
MGLLLLATGAAAEEFALQVNRVGGDLYVAPAEGLYIETQYCFALADATAARLIFNTDADKLIFTETEETCEVRMIFGKAAMEPGDYLFSVTRVADNWYRIDEQNAALLTEGCLKLVEGAEARVTLTEAGDGTLLLPEADEECRVVGAYAQAELALEEVAQPADAEDKSE